MFALFVKLVKQNARTVGVYTAISIAFLWMYVALFPSFKDQGDQFAQIMSAVPEAVVKAFGISADMFTNFEYFIGTEHYSIVWPILVIIFVLGLASNALAGEIESGTIELLLAQPLTRTQVFWAKYLSGAGVIVLFIFLSVMAVIPLGWIYNISVQVGNHLLLAAMGTLFGLALFSFGMMVSGLATTKGRVASSVGGLAIAMYVMNILAKLQESLEWLKYGSFFYYFDHQITLVEGRAEWLGIAVFTTVVVLTTLVGWWYFLKRDLSA